MENKRLIEILVAISVLTLLLSNFYSYKEQKVSNDLIECVDVQIKVLDVRADLNEYLNRYSIYDDIILNQTNNVDESNLEWFFNKDLNTQRFFDEIDNLNLMRPYWEECSSNLFLFINQRKSYSLVSSFFFWITLILDIVAIYLLFRKEKTK
ncbi:hypothetical protein J4466_03850 [Candidatus Pacearchaeota archaeon]|nr:hypothetical protein [Candidatus Pacearchaeota archaeon]